MDRREAYRILSAELAKVASSIRSGSPTNTSIELTANGRSGTLYTMRIRVEEQKLLGSIHSNNSQKFELLEEAIEL